MSELIKGYDSDNNFDFLDFNLGNGVQAMVLVSLLTNKAVEGKSRANAGSRSGLTIGSELWSEINSPRGADVELRIKAKAERSLQWLIDENIAKSVNVVVSQLNQSGYSLRVTIERSESNRFRDLWALTEESTFQINPLGSIEILIK